eukprot:TRINITY_DN622_c0_g1_i3.p1 TRINITY_DN622_c0_g1~~TRINITY_DN622_c0_g1_i3.p1  ORF type:complete len:126 (-),score=44.49 TRINITY_DN622_c0_g1_i3:216-593(-)
MQTQLISPEEQERQEKLREVEERRMQALQEKLQHEKQVKQERIQKAKNDLAQWQNDRKTANEKRRQNNRAEHDALLEAKANNTLYKNSWEKVAGNITLKEGDYPGSKEVSRMRQAILAKKADLSK